MFAVVILLYCCSTVLRYKESFCKSDTTIEAHTLKGAIFFKGVVLLCGIAEIEVSCLLQEKFIKTRHSKTEMAEYFKKIILHKDKKWVTAEESTDVNRLPTTWLAGAALYSSGIIKNGFNNKFLNCHANTY